MFWNDDGEEEERERKEKEEDEEKEKDMLRVLHSALATLYHH